MIMGLAEEPISRANSKPVAMEGSSPFSGSRKEESSLSIIIVGASGDLASQKIFPALFALFYEDCLPENATGFGYARSKMTDEELRNMISQTLTCRIDKRENCGDKMDEFLKRCFYHFGEYNSEEHFARLDCKLKEKEGGRSSFRLFYLSIPPNIFVDVVRCASTSASSKNGWTRVIVEKPFGHNLHLFLIASYFDNYGIIHDIMQNHLLQILALFAMETPVSLDAEDIRNEKVKVLRSMRLLQLEDVMVGQYKGHSKGGRTYPGYTDDPSVPNDSLTPTIAAASLFIDNARWDGVPFLMRAGKALHTKRLLVLRVQPDEAIYLKINNKVPGLGMRLDRSDLNLLYKARSDQSRYPKEIPDAYERLLLDAIEGERRLFIRSDELDAAWSLFTPLLKELEEKKIAPELYPYGSRGPVGVHYLAAKHNVRWGDLSAYLEEVDEKTKPFRASVNFAVGDKASSLDGFSEPPSNKLLPDLHPLERHVFTLVLDLNETLVYSDWKRERGWRTFKRPGVEAFLEHLGQFYEIVVYSDQLNVYVDSILERLDAKGSIRHRLSRTKTNYRDGKHYRDFSKLNRDPSIILYVSGHALESSLQPENSVPVKPWKLEADDTALVDLIPFLEYVARHPPADIRPVLASYQGRHIATEFIERSKVHQRRMQEQKQHGLFLRR
ncbi:hypothetical protein RHGRI_011451 [Rhododendron griersonianum]|uniref:FCP1 homology domain-containing protein n=1 Tax=Rhododendron griersonianum TaxID=479676 RepID=A0AAV6KLT0_9ERIC|nr:hypothetical protein RHGRI_011451 [Rhododendron griersonianum]